jgi:hypothetical protein
MQKNAFDPRVGKPAAAGDFEPTPGAIAAAQSAAGGKRRAILRCDLLQVRPNRADVGRVRQRVKAAAEEFLGEVPKVMQKCGIRKLHVSLGRENRDDFLCGIQQRRKLCGPESNSGVRGNSLGHFNVASVAGWSAELPAGLAEASKDRADARMRLLKVNRLFSLYRSGPISYTSQTERDAN